MDIEEFTCDSYDFLLNWKNIKVDGNVPQPRHAHSACVIDDYMYVYGGYGLTTGLGHRGIHLGDLYRFHLLTQHWERKPIPSKTLKLLNARHSHSTVVYGQSFWIFGGIGQDQNNNPVIYNEVIEYNVQTSEVTVHPNPTTTGHYIPSPRWGHTGCVYQDQMLVFGGMNEFSFFSSVISFSFKTKLWTQLEVVDTTINPVPHGRQYHSSGVVGDKLYIFGGYDGVLCRNDMFALDLKTLIWRGIAGPHVSRRGASTAVFGQSIYIFGGRHKRIHDSLYEFNTETLTWKEIISGNRPTKRQSSSLVIYRDSLYLFGGQSEINENDMFSIPLSNDNNHHESDHHSFAFCGNMLNNPAFSDLKFRVEDRIIYAHKAILVSRNEKFRAMITSGMEESRKDTIDILNISYSAFLALLHWIYTGQVYFKNVNVLQLISISDQYMIPELKLACSNGLLKYINKKNIDQYHTIAESFELKELLKYINNFKIEQQDDINKNK